MLKITNFRKHLVGIILLLAGTVATASVPSLPVNESDITVKGKVINEKGESLPGVNVFVKVANKGTSTDVDGAFSIRIPRGSKLIFSYIGSLLSGEIFSK